MIIKVRPVSYAIVDGELPQGMSFSTTTGRVTGFIDPSAFVAVPQWQTPSARLGAFNEGDEIEPIQIEAILPEESDSTELTYTVVDGFRNNQGLPWGLTLHPQTGVIQGTIADLKNPLSLSWLPEEEPAFVTPEGSIGTFTELDTVGEVFVEATPYGERTLLYSISTGNLPWGLTLDTYTGELSGTVFRLNTLEDIPVATPKPLWLTNSGAIISVDENAEVEAAIKAVPRLGTKLNYKIIGGGLPWGLKLDQATGDITGTTAGIKTPVPMELPAYQQPKWRTDSGRIVTVGENDNVSFKINVLPFNDRNVYLTIVSGFLPPGLIMTNLGQVSGKVMPLDRIPAGFTLRPKPSWTTTEGALGIYDEDETVTLSINATPNLGTTINYKIIGGGLPWGIRLNQNTGAITGKTKEIKTPESPFAPVEEKPVWVSPASSSVEYTELQEIAPIQFTATPVESRKVTYSAVNLPWGLSMTNDGLVTGKLARLEVLPEGFEHETRPEWSTEAGSLGATTEKSGFGASISASGSNVRYKIVEGGLPWGLRLDQSSGSIFGTTQTILQSVPTDTNELPTFSVAENTDIGTVTRGQGFSYSIGATAGAGRSITSIDVVPSSAITSALPLGLTMTTGGSISGTVDIEAQVGIYTVEISATDSFGAFASVHVLINVQQEAS